MLYAREEKEFRKTTRERNHADGCAPFATMEVSTPSLFAPSSSSFSPSLFSYHLDRAARQAKGHRPHRALAGPVDERVYFRHDELRGGGVRAVRGGGGDRAAIDETRRGDGGRRHGGSRGGGGARERRRGGPQRHRGSRREQRQGCPRGRSHCFREGERGRGRRKKRKTPLRAATICVSMGFFFFSPFTLSFLLSFNKRNLNRAARGTGLDPPSPPNAQRQKSMLVAARRWATTSPPSPSLSSPSLSPLLLSPLSLSLSLSLLLRCPCSPSSSTPRHRRRLCVVVSGLPLRLPSSPCSSASSLL